MSDNVRPAHEAKRFEATVSQIHDEGCNIRTFRLALLEGTTLDFRPGQFVLISFPGDPETKRPFSLASSPLQKDHIEITVGRYGSFAEKLFTLRGGEKLILSQSQGTWQFRDEDKHAVLISQNAGIAPLRSMIRYVLDKGLPTKLSLFYAEKQPSCILYRQELEEFRREGVNVHTTITETVPEGELWDGPTGPITMKAVRKHVKDLKNASFYICGPNRFVDTISAQLLKAEVPKKSLLLSKWGDF